MRGGAIFFFWGGGYVKKLWKLNKLVGVKKNFVGKNNFLGQYFFAVNTCFWYKIFLGLFFGTNIFVTLQICLRLKKILVKKLGPKTALKFSWLGKPHIKKQIQFGQWLEEGRVNTLPKLSRALYILHSFCTSYLEIS